MRKTLPKQNLTVVIDTREQKPFGLGSLRRKRGTLVTGDYSLAGLEDVVAIERKSLDDLVGCTTGKGRSRFSREIKRLQAYPVRAIICEGSYSLIEAAQYHGRVHPNAVMGSIAGWVCDGIPVIMAGSRQRADETCQRMLLIAARRRYEEWAAFADELGNVPDDGGEADGNQEVGEILQEDEDSL